MSRSAIMADVINSLGTLLTSGEDGHVERQAEFGNFKCAIEGFDHFRMVRRQFEVGSDAVEIPFSSHKPGIQMIFSLDAPSFFNNRNNPLRLGPVSHTLNFLKQYDCKNLLYANARQNDIGFWLDKDFYTHLITDQLTFTENRLPTMILQNKEFNTINQHLPSDAAVLGILKNIMECPFNGSMRDAFIREHVRVLFMLQIFHFSPVVAGEPINLPNKISRADRDVLYAVKQYIDDHFLNPASLQLLSKQFGINEYKLKYGFKALFDTSPIRYLQWKRLQYSLTLLRDTDLSIKQIANEIGYTHAANFTTAFTKAFSSSPWIYRSERQEVLA
jgi:AraC-like DNA-binding protein